MVTESAADLNITGVTCDSRRVEPGYLFAAFPGSRTDGRGFIADAIRNGARAVLGPPGTPPDAQHPDIPVITDDDPRRLYALISARFFETQPKTVAAITGTSGKTSTAYFLRQIWNAQGLSAGSMGTLGVHATDSSGVDLLSGGDKPLTTPDAADLHRQLRRLTGLGVDHLALEASSHGLDQRRLDGVRISAAAFTNLSRDHLDYHADESAYFDAKMRLFRDLLVESGTAVINADHAYAKAVTEICRTRRLSVRTYGERGDDVRLVARQVRPAGQQLTLAIDGRDHTLLLPLVGAFQASNALCALALALASDVGADQAVAAIAGLRGAPGRMELIGQTAKGAAVYVDYAHKPDALRRALEALRPHTSGRLAVVFGCGGERDAGKRPVMGRIAEDLADRVIVTDDNPRGEDAAAIRTEILRGGPSATEIADRADAIATAMAELAAGDILVVAGKGHETGQIIGEEVLAFNDAEAVRRIIGGFG